MSKMRVMALLLAVVMVFSLPFVAGCGKKDQAPTGGDQTEQQNEQQQEQTAYDGPKVLDYYVNAEPQTLDAQQMYGQPDMFIANMFIEGLTRAGQEEGQFVPGVAKEWKYDEASNSWEFVLRDDAKWHDGTPVTADDFFFAWKLALDTHAPYSFMLTEFIVGAEEYAGLNKEGYLMEKDAEFKALKDSLKDASDDKKKEIKDKIAKRIEAMTADELSDYNAKKDELWSKVQAKEKDGSIVITLKAPAPFYPSLVAMPVYFPMNEKFYNEHKAAGDYNLEASGLYANGPWVVKEWEHKASFKLVRNEQYWNKDNINLDELNIKIVTDIETRTNLLKTDALDGSAIQAKDLKDFEDVATLDQYNLQEMRDMSDFSVFYVEFNHFNNPITQNANIRKALAVAMDRQSFVEKINFGDAPALAFVPTEFPGLEKTFREENGVGLIADNAKEKAKEYLAKGLKELGMSELPALDLLIGDSDIANKIAVKFQADWAEVGITVNLVPLPWGERLNRLQSGDFSMMSSGWGPDYPDPMSYLEVFQSGNGNNHGQYSNAKFDELILKAKAEKNAKVRMGYMYEAEKVLMEDMAMAPQYFRTAHWTYKNYLTGVVNRGIGANTDFYWADVDMEAKLADKE